MTKRWFAALAAMAIGGGVTPAHATLTAFIDPASFGAAAGQRTGEGFEFVSPQILAAPGNPSFSATFGAFTLTGSGNGDFVGIANGSQAASVNGTKFLQIGSTDPLTGASAGDGGVGPSVTFQFAAIGPRTAFGFRWVDTDPDGSYKVIINGTTFADPPSVAAGTGSGFFGVVATGGETFTSISIVQDAAGGAVDPFGIDEIQYSFAAPEPSALALAFTALPMGLGFAWKRRRKD